jgi:hypothetical protein
MISKVFLPCYKYATSLNLSRKEFQIFLELHIISQSSGRMIYNLGIKKLDLLLSVRK